MVIQIDIEIERLFGHGIVQGVFGDQDMSAETVNFVFDSFLKALHDEKRGYDGGQADSDARDGDLVDGR